MQQGLIVAFVGPSTAACIRDGFENGPGIGRVEHVSQRRIDRSSTSTCPHSLQRVRSICREVLFVRLQIRSTERNSTPLHAEPRLLHKNRFPRSRPSGRHNRESRWNRLPDDCLRQDRSASSARYFWWRDRRRRVAGGVEMCWTRRIREIYKHNGYL